MNVKTQLKAGGFTENHSETLVSARLAGLVVRTQLKAAW